METNYSIGSEAINGKKTTYEKGGTSFHLSAHRLLSDISLITLIILRQLYLQWLYTSLALSIIQLDLRPKLCVYFFIFSPLIILSFMQLLIDLYSTPWQLQTWNLTHLLHLLWSKMDPCQWGTCKIHLIGILWI